MASIREGSLIKFGDGGLVISVPIAWARFHGLRPGDKVDVITNGELRVRLRNQTKKITAESSKKEETKNDRTN